MKVTLRQRRKGKRISLYLDYYENGNRKYEYLKLYLTPEPDKGSLTKAQKLENKKILQLAESIRAKRHLEIQNNIYGFENKEKKQGNFFVYLEQWIERRSESKGNLAVWNSTLKHLKAYYPKLQLPCPLFVLNINKTKSQDIIAFDQNWNGELIPMSGTYINIGPKGEYKYLLFNNLRYNNTVKYPSHSSYSFPIKLKISSPTPEALNDSKMIRKLIEQVYQFSRLYWKSLRQQNVPITIKYPEMVAQIAPRFNNGVPDDAKDALWFL